MDHRRAPWGPGSGVPYPVQSCPSLFSHIYSTGFISLPSMWPHGGGKGGGEGHHPPQPDSLTLHAQPGPCPMPSLPESVSGPQVHFPRKSPPGPAGRGPLLTLIPGVRELSQEKGVGAGAKGDPGKAPSGGLERSGEPKESSSGSPFMDVCQPVANLHHYVIMGSRVSGF